MSGRADPAGTQRRRSAAEGDSRRAIPQDAVPARRSRAACVRATYDAHMRVLLPALACVLLAACASAPRPAPDAAIYLVVRHAEKVDASRDPDLSAAGQARAQALAARLDGLALDAVYATEFKRTGQTVGPTAAGHGLAITPYSARQPAPAFADQLRATHARGTVLIAGHSDTVPDIVAALCACDVAPMPDHEYDRLSIVHVDAAGRARLDVQRYGAASPTP